MEGAEEKMEVIIDTNKVLASIISSGKVRKIVVFSPINFFAPKYLVHEIDKHKEDICKRFKLSIEDFNFIKNELIFPRINVINEILYEDAKNDAHEIAKTFDPKDTPFIALSLKLNIPIWTNDKKMIEYGLRTGKYLALDTRAVKGDLRRRYNLMK